MQSAVKYSRADKYFEQRNNRKPGESLVIQIALLCSQPLFFYCLFMAGNVCVFRISVLCVEPMQWYT